MPVILIAVALLSFGPATLDAEPAPSAPTLAWSPPTMPQKGKKIPWTRSIKTPAAKAMGAPMHRCLDTVVTEGEEQYLIAKFAYGTVDKDLKKELVDIWILPEGGAWKKLAMRTTSDDGQHPDFHGVTDDGGYVFYTIPSESALPVGRHVIVMVVKGDLTTCTGSLWVMAKGTTLVVFDIDGTLTTSDEELFSELEDEDYDQEMRPGAVEVVEHYAAKGVVPVYVTGRPDMLKGITVSWLEDKGFPVGPVFLTSSLSQSAPSIVGVGTYKLSTFKGLLAKGLPIVAAYGNAKTDTYAYTQAGLSPFYVFGSTIDSYVSHLGELQKK